jgi:hypothetical protein
MTKTVAAVAIIIVAALFTTACAQTRKTTTIRSGASHVRVLRATQERILPGREEGDIITNYRIRLQWRSASKPAAFFFRPQAGWMQCLVVKGDGSETEVSPEAIKKSQVVDIVPVADGRTPVPAFVKSADKNKLYFQIGSSWYSVPVTLTKTKDVVAP